MKDFFSKRDSYDSKNINSKILHLPDEFILIITLVVGKKIASSEKIIHIFTSLVKKKRSINRLKNHQTLRTKLINGTKTIEHVSIVKKNFILFVCDKYLFPK